MTEREQFEKAFPVPDGAVWWDVIEAYCRKNKTTVHQYNDKWQAWQAARATMTEREQFEKAFPVPVSMVWNGFTYAIVDAHEISSCWDYQLRWETWQAARATPALPDGMAIVPVETQKDAERYRFIRMKIGYDRHGVTLPCGNTKGKPEETDAAIDAAMLAAAKEKGE